MDVVTGPRRRLSVTEAAGRGLSRLLNDAADGTETVVENHGRPVAAIVGSARLEMMSELEQNLRSVLLVAARLLTDDGQRCSLEDVATRLGFDLDAIRAEAHADPDAVLAD